MSKSRNCCAANFEEYLVYTTKKELRVKNKFIAGVYLVGMLSISLYVVAYTIILQKGYQLVAFPSGYVSTKISGLGFNYEGSATNDSYFESVDLVWPPIEMDGLFLTTAVVETWQSRGICDGDVECDSDDNCTEGDSGFDGIQSGECLNGHCQEYRWCPAENDTLTESNLIFGVENFTIFVRVLLEFRDFGVYMVNTEDRLGNGELINGYNSFTVKDILDDCGVEMSDIQRSGMLVRSDISYYCDFDIDDKCNPYPKFEWAREDIDENSVSTGFNFRNVFFSFDEGDEVARLLKKFHGIRFRFNIQGYGGKWDLGAFSTTLGSGIALTAIAGVITEIFLRHCVSRRKFYATRRIEVVDMNQEEEWVRSSMGGLEVGSKKLLPLASSLTFESDADGESGRVLKFM